MKPATVSSSSITPAGAALMNTNLNQSISPFLGLSDRAFGEFTKSHSLYWERDREEQRARERARLYSNASAIPHLHAYTAEIVQLSDYERMQAIDRQKWIPYTQARHIQSIMEDMYNQIRSSQGERSGPDLLILGEPANGVSSLFRTFVGEPYADSYSGQLHWPVIRVVMPIDPTPESICSAIQNALCIPYSKQETLAYKVNLLSCHFLNMRTRMLAIDDIQHLFALSPGKQKKVAAVLEDLHTYVWMIWGGHWDITKGIPSIGHQTQVEVLNKWEYNDELKRLLLSFERLLPLKKPSQISHESLAKAIVAESQGAIGPMEALLMRAAKLAIRTKSEAITLAVLQEAISELATPFDMAPEQESFYSAKVLADQ
jgi:hypothetical protein